MHFVFLTYDRSKVSLNPKRLPNYFIMVAKIVCSRKSLQKQPKTRFLHEKLLPCLLCLSLGPSIFSKVEVIEISPSNTAVLPGGKEADGIIGDFVLRNSQIEVTIGGGAPTVKQIWVLFGGQRSDTGLSV